MGALMEFHFEALREYREENTALFYLVLSTVDMTGTRHETDIAYIERHFHNGAQRDGQSFLKWLHKFGNHSDTPRVKPGGSVCLKQDGCCVWRN